MSEGAWETLKVDADYEINNMYPYQIRRKSNQRIISECESNRGYLVCALNKKHCLKHRIIATQWIENPNEYQCVDHINHIRTDNHISNLRWVSYNQNGNNKSHQTFVDSISDEAIVVDHYNDREFEDLFFYEDVFYKYNGINYVVKPKYLNLAGNYFIHIRDVTGKSCRITYTNFKRQYGLI